MKINMTAAEIRFLKSYANTYYHILDLIKDLGYDLSAVSTDVAKDLIQSELNKLNKKLNKGVDRLNNLRSKHSDIIKYGGKIYLINEFIRKYDDYSN